jgi:hypothetical protein
MTLPDFTVEHLKQLPLRAIVAFAVRCARRVEPLAQSAVDDPDRALRGATIAAALRMAENVAQGTDTAPDPSLVGAIDAVAAAPGGSLASRNAAAATAEAAHSAVCVLNAMLVRETEQYRPPVECTAGDQRPLGVTEHDTVELIALDAFTAAMEAYDAIGYDNERFVSAALNDYDRLRGMKLGRYPELGAPIDPSQHGPLGPI